MSINSRNLLQIFTDSFFEKISPSVFWGPLEWPTFLELECWYSCGTTPWRKNSWITNANKIPPNDQGVARLTSKHTSSTYIERRHTKSKNTFFRIQEGLKSINPSESVEIDFLTIKILSRTYYTQEKENIGGRMAGALWVLSPVMRAQPLRIMFFKTDQAETLCENNP